MDGSTVRGNLKEQIFGIGTSCIHGRFVQGENISDWFKQLNTNKERKVVKDLVFHDNVKYIIFLSKGIFHTESRLTRVDV